MPRIYNLILCRSHENSPEKGYSAFQIFGTLGIRTIPERISFSVLASIYEPKTGKTHVEIRLNNPEGEKITAAVGDMDYKDGGIVDPGFSGLNISARFENIEIKTIGIYSVEVLADNEIIDSKQFCIYQSGSIAGGDKNE